MHASTATPATSKKATPKSVTTPKGVTSAASTITEALTPAAEAELDRRSAEKTNVEVTLRMGTLSETLKELPETELRKSLFARAEMYFRCDLQYEAAGRKRDHARYELGETLYRFQRDYEKTWPTMREQLAKGLGVDEKTVDRIIKEYLLQKQISKTERIVAMRLGLNPKAKALVAELVEIARKDGPCLSEKEAHSRVPIAAVRMNAKLTKRADPARDNCEKAITAYMKTLPPDERIDKLTDISELVALKLSAEVLGE
jgi:hypothetical protein